MDGEVVADLHIHTTASDGKLEVAELPARARRAGLDAVGVTDHDRIHPELPAPVIDRDGVTVVRGIELRVSADRGRVDLLGYGVRRTDALTAELDRLQRDRVERAERMVTLVETELGVDLDIVPEPGVGRPQVARAVEASRAPQGYEAAFDELIGENGPCYVPRPVPSLERGVGLLARASDLVALAHPLRYAAPAAAITAAVEAGVDGIELDYPYERDVDTTPVERAVERHGLVPTGGSDAHGLAVGRTGVPRGAWQRIAARLRGA